ncbi:hypothetical protein GALMADRAFT_139613 [Galerina marginata CBS 339.88]|uniref:Uncharacterized protein n=1 Tax=Galerina marginata (strain CBS 339.88) TaxID=685588 RepID=A0A067T0J2_GALM3|nr:hypothetical protein GALMADRAFT_139613 [Galerina marginata CBS 339.88]
MAAPAPILPDISIQLSMINTRLNSMMLETFLMGMYSIVYFGTLYLYLTKPVAQRRTVVIAITLLYVFGLCAFASEWYFLQWFFLKNGETRGTVFLSLFMLPPWVHLADNIFVFLMLVLADGLQVWRCFYVWGRSFRVIAVPTLLCAAEISLFLTSVISISVTKAQPTESQGTRIDNIESAGYLISAVTSLTTTFLIAHRINKMLQHDNYSMRRFTHIIEILVQSVAVYSVMLLIEAISGLIPVLNQNETKVYAYQVYSAVLVVPITGIAPTIMVARICLASSSESTAISTPGQLSSLRFQFRRSTRHTEGNDTQIYPERIMAMGHSDQTLPHDDEEKNKTETS